jgi:hypothetical protein
MKAPDNQCHESGLFSVELNLFIASLVLASAFHEVFECDFLCSPGMRQYGILRDGTTILLRQTQDPVFFILPSENAQLQGSCFFPRQSAAVPAATLKVRLRASRL